MPSLNAIRRRFAQSCEFATVYVTEAHVTEEWPMGCADRCTRQPRSLDERRAVARRFAAEQALEWPLYVDAMDDAFENAYAAWPERLYVISADGTLLYKSGVGPFYFSPADLESWLAENTTTL